MRHSFARLQSRVVSDVTIPALRPLISSRRERALQPGLTIGEILLKRDPAKPALADEELQDRDRRREATGRTAAYTALSVWIDNSLSFSAGCVFATCLRNAVIQGRTSLSVRHSRSGKPLQKNSAPELFCRKICLGLRAINSSASDALQARSRRCPSRRPSPRSLSFAPKSRIFRRAPPNVYRRSPARRRRS